MSRSVIIVSPSFDAAWPYAADHFHALWQDQGEVLFIRLDEASADAPISSLIPDVQAVQRLACFQASLTMECASLMGQLKEAAIYEGYGKSLQPAIQQLKDNGVQVYGLTSEGFWGQSVSEFALALTLCGLRRIPQTHGSIIRSHMDWQYWPADGKGVPGGRGEQFGDDPRFANGTVHGKRVRIIGAGNIASRYASFVHMLGADVAAWDPYASEPCFHRAGTRRIRHVSEITKDADIFVPMVPHTAATEGLVNAELIHSLPQGCLVVLVTRAQICDMGALRARVLADELSLAADVFDMEPLPLDDPLLGRHNVVHTPHNAGRTIHANQQLAAMLAEQFLPRGGN